MCMVCAWTEGLVGGVENPGRAIMNGNVLQVAVPIIGLISGLIATYVSLQNRALVAEVRKEIAELENRILLRINGTFVRCSECQVRSEGIQRQFASLVEEVSCQGSRRPVGATTPCSRGSRDWSRTSG